jgi:hypothetical protein
MDSSSSLFPVGETFTHSWVERNPPRADTFGMPKLSLRDFWGKRTEKKALNPEMRDMLLKLDGVYEMPRSSSEPSPQPATEQQPSATSQSS